MASRFLTWILGFAFCYSVLTHNRLGVGLSGILGAVFIVMGFDFSDEED